ncbi:hypothetical protein [Stappia sp.]|jgi:hypothetical protein|uniref:hypothetical protein n=1 Tax=Stappia sp. TaxID=1870903 RepID=UPI003A98F6E0
MRMRANAIALGLVAGLIATVPALAQQDRPQVDKDRYVLAPAGDIFLRLDRNSGRVAECSRHNESWRCVAVPDAQKAMEAEIARLGDQVAALKAETDRLRAQLGEDQKEDPYADKPDGPGPQFTPREEKELDEALDFTEKAMRRFFGMMKTLKKEYDGLQE